MFNLFKKKEILSRTATAERAEALKMYVSHLSHSLDNTRSAKNLSSARRMAVIYVARTRGSNRLKPVKILMTLSGC